MHRSGHSLRHRVWGIEADIQSLDLSDSHGGKFRYTTNNAPYNLSTSTKTDWLFTLRGRVGYAFNRSLVYFTGGLAVTAPNVSASPHSPRFRQRGQTNRARRLDG
jgi:opacity protein-like surface antigen